MILDDLERQNRGCYGFFGNFGLRDIFLEPTAPNSLQIDQDNLHNIEFLALNVNLNSISPTF